MNIFELASRNKYRYRTSRGVITAEDLWDLPLLASHAPCLDVVARDLNKQLIVSEEESFVATKPANVSLRNALEVIKYIIDVKLQEEEDRKADVLIAARKSLLTSALAGKELEEVKGMSAKTIKKELGKLQLSS